ncbi:MAG: YkgJ family cysteine cluster protein [Proteobacteria bacterium]|nr:YkgJ family cysteine cluster protein [Pseudomonadota bacterium]
MPQKPDAQALQLFHREIDAAAAALAARHADRLQCRRGCHACCVDDLTVFEVEADRIRSAHGELLRTGTPHPPGACAFLGEAGECRIYADRPYVCRTQGLPLRWLAEDETEEIVERRDICPLNAEGPPLSTLAEDDCWLLGPAEDRLARLQETHPKGPERRVALRVLFAGS